MDWTPAPHDATRIVGSALTTRIRTRARQIADGALRRSFLERVFHKLLLNFTWWVNRKDAEGRNIFQGGFLGLDNIGVFDRSSPLPTGGHLEQADGTAWMAFYCQNMLEMALVLADHDPADQADDQSIGSPT